MSDYIPIEVLKGDSWGILLQVAWPEKALVVTQNKVTTGLENLNRLKNVDVRTMEFICSEGNLRVSFTQDVDIEPNKAFYCATEMKNAEALFDDIQLKHETKRPSGRNTHGIVKKPLIVYSANGRTLLLGYFYSVSGGTIEPDSTVLFKAQMSFGTTDSQLPELHVEAMLPVTSVTTEEFIDVDDSPLYHVVDGQLTNDDNDSLEVIQQRCPGRVPYALQRLVKSPSGSRAVVEPTAKVVYLNPTGFRKKHTRQRSASAPETFPDLTTDSTSTPTPSMSKQGPASSSTPDLFRLQGGFTRPPLSDGNIYNSLGDTKPSLVERDTVDAHNSPEEQLTGVTPTSSPLRTQKRNRGGSSNRMECHRSGSNSTGSTKSPSHKRRVLTPTSSNVDMTSTPTSQHPWHSISFSSTPQSGTSDISSSSNLFPVYMDEINPNESIPTTQTPESQFQPTPTYTPFPNENAVHSADAFSALDLQSFLISPTRDQSLSTCTLSSNNSTPHSNSSTPGHQQMLHDRTNFDCPSIPVSPIEDEKLDAVGIPVSPIEDELWWLI